jgi:hypothetical protein
MPLGPRSAACVRPAPKSRFVVSGLLRKKIKIKIKINSNSNSNSNGNGNGNGNGLHQTCSSPARRRGDLEGITASKPDCYGFATITDFELNI